MAILPRPPIWDWILEHIETLTSSENMSENITKQDLKHLQEVH